MMATLGGAMAAVLTFGISFWRYRKCARKKKKGVARVAEGRGKSFIQ
jgi:hypothetical protein